MDIEIEVTGLRDVYDFLERAPFAVERRVIKSALRAAARPLIKEMRGRVGEYPDHARAIRYSGDRRKAEIGRVKVPRPLIFVEYGVTPHEIVDTVGKALLAQGPGGAAFGPAVLHPGVTARPFVASSASAAAARMVAAFGDGIGKAMEREAARYRSGRQ